MALEEYGRKRDFKKTPEPPPGRITTRKEGLSYLVQKHDATRILAHAQQNGCFFEINSSPDHLDLSADNARLADAAGVKIAVSTDAHSMREFENVIYGINHARRAGLEKTSVLNCLPLNKLLQLFKRN